MPLRDREWRTRGNMTAMNATNASIPPENSPRTQLSGNSTVASIGKQSLRDLARVTQPPKNGPFDERRDRCCWTWLS